MIETQHFTVSIDPRTGAISGLREKAKDRDWATAKNPLGIYSYQTFSKQDFDRFIASYIHSTEDWAFKDFGKPGIDRFGAQSREWAPTLVHLWSGEDSHGYRVLAELRVEDPESEKLGTVAWPRTMFLELKLPNDAPVVEMNFYWFGKVANRLPEAAWLSFYPVCRAMESGCWEKLESGFRLLMLWLGVTGTCMLSSARCVVPVLRLSLWTRLWWRWESSRRFISRESNRISRRGCIFVCTTIRGGRITCSGSVGICGSGLFCA